MPIQNPPPPEGGDRGILTVFAMGGGGGSETYFGNFTIYMNLINLNFLQNPFRPRMTHYLIYTGITLYSNPQVRFTQQLASVSKLS